MKLKKKQINSLSLVMMLFLYGITISGQTISKLEPIYDDVWGSLYNPEYDQCDNTPTITADGSKINYSTASTHRWVAISQDLLNNQYRLKNFIKDSTDNRFRGKIKFGDTIWVDSPNPNINGIWVVHDVMNKKYKNAIDFLQTTGDSKLYGNDKLWDGKFKNIVIYKIVKTPVEKILKVKVLQAKDISLHIENVKHIGLIMNNFIEISSPHETEFFKSVIGELPTHAKGDGGLHNFIMNFRSFIACANIHFWC